MEYIAILILSIYTLLVCVFIAGFYFYKKSTLQKPNAKHGFSILVPFRNEAPQLKALLLSLSKLDYPSELYEIILINDESTDDYKTVLSRFKSMSFQCIEAIPYSQSPKKDALETGIKNAKHPWIVTTDADCLVPKYWLQMFNQFIEKNNSVFIAAPVKFLSGPSLLSNLQQLNLFSLMGSTIGSFGLNKPIMCNGANLCFSKAVFFEVNGYEGTNTVASGDDVFLLEKMQNRYPKKVHYLKSLKSLVITLPEKSWTSWMHQQLRWASKTPAYTNPFTKLTGIVVFLMNISVLILLILAIFGNLNWVFFYKVVSVKTIVDVLLIFQTAHFYKSYRILKYVPVFVLFYPLFVVFLSFLAPFKTYHWKGRHIRPSKLPVK